MSIVSTQTALQLESFCGLLGVRKSSAASGRVDAQAFQLAWRVTENSSEALIVLSSGLQASYDRALSCLAPAGELWFPNRMSGILQRTYFANDYLWCEGAVAIHAPVQTWLRLVDRQRAGLKALLRSVAE